MRSPCWMHSACITSQDGVAGCDLQWPTSTTCRRAGCAAQRHQQLASLCLDASIRRTHQQQAELDDGAVAPLVGSSAGCARALFPLWPREALLNLDGPGVCLPLSHCQDPAGLGLGLAPGLQWAAVARLCTVRQTSNSSTLKQGVRFPAALNAQATGWQPKHSRKLPRGQLPLAAHDTLQRTS